METVDRTKLNDYESVVNKIDFEIKNLSGKQKETIEQLKNFLETLFNSKSSIQDSLNAQNKYFSEQIVKGALKIFDKEISEGTITSREISKYLSEAFNEFSLDSIAFKRGNLIVLRGFLLKTVEALLDKELSQNEGKKNKAEVENSSESNDEKRVKEISSETLRNFSTKFAIPFISKNIINEGRSFKNLTLKTLKLGIADLNSTTGANLNRTSLNLSNSLTNSIQSQSVSTLKTYRNNLNNVESKVVSNTTNTIKKYGKKLLHGTLEVLDFIFPLFILKGGFKLARFLVSGAIKTIKFGFKVGTTALKYGFKVISFGVKTIVKIGSFTTKLLFNVLERLHAFSLFKFTSKGILKFLRTPAGAFLLGYVVGKIYKNVSEIFEFSKGILNNLKDGFKPVYDNYIKPITDWFSESAIGTFLNLVAIPLVKPGNRKNDVNAVGFFFKDFYKSFDGKESIIEEIVDFVNKFDLRSISQTLNNLRAGILSGNLVSMAQSSIISVLLKIAGTAAGASIGGKLGKAAIAAGKFSGPLGAAVSIGITFLGAMIGEEIGSEIASTFAKFPTTYVFNSVKAKTPEEATSFDEFIRLSREQHMQNLQDSSMREVKPKEVLSDEDKARTFMVGNKAFVLKDIEFEHLWNSPAINHNVEDYGKIIFYANKKNAIDEINDVFRSLPEYVGDKNRNHTIIAKTSNIYGDFYSLNEPMAYMERLMRAYFLYFKANEALQNGGYVTLNNTQHLFSELLDHEGFNKYILKWYIDNPKTDAPWNIKIGPNRNKRTIGEIIHYLDENTHVGGTGIGHRYDAGYKNFGYVEQYHHFKNDVDTERSIGYKNPLWMIFNGGQIDSALMGELKLPSIFGIEYTFYNTSDGKVKFAKGMIDEYFPSVQLQIPQKMVAQNMPQQNAAVKNKNTLSAFVKSFGLTRDQSLNRFIDTSFYDIDGLENPHLCFLVRLTKSYKGFTDLKSMIDFIGKNRSEVYGITVAAIEELDKNNPIFDADFVVNPSKYPERWYTDIDVFLEKASPFLQSFDQVEFDFEESYRRSYSDRHNLNLLLNGRWITDETFNERAFLATVYANDFDLETILREHENYNQKEARAFLKRLPEALRVIIARLEKIRDREGTSEEEKTRISQSIILLQNRLEDLPTLRIPSSEEQANPSVD